MEVLDPLIPIEELKRRYGLTILDEPSDFMLQEDGDLKLTRDGDIPVGDDVYGAVWRLVVAWRYLTPTLSHLLYSREALLVKEPQLEAVANRQHDLSNPWLHGDTLVTRAHQAEALAAREALHAGGEGMAVLAGSTIMLLQQLLNRFKKDLKASADEWSTGRPAVTSISIGQLCWAAANAYRHADEWKEARASGKIDNRQRTSMSVLDRAVGADTFMPYATLSWERALDAVGGRSLDQLSGNVLRFAHDVALKVRARPA